MAVIDEAYATLARTGYEYRGGLSNHGPMACEALLALGREDDVLPWLRGYLPRLADDVPRPSGDVPDEHALGDHRRVADWTARAAADLESRPWQEVLADWVRLLAPGAVAAAGHGVIRTAHAVRSLAAEDTPPRRTELAAGLGYWAAHFHPLPGSPDLRGPDGLSRTWQLLPDVPPAPGRLITDALRALEDVPAFGQAVESLGCSDAELPAVLSAITAAAASALIAAPAAQSITLVHAVTTPAAVRLLLPHLPAEQHRLAVAAAWQASAALLATTTRPQAMDGIAADAGELVDRAVRSGDEHAIKYTEACLREDALAPDPVYAAAASTYLRRLELNRL